MFDVQQLPFPEAIISNATDGIVICDMRLPGAPIIFSNPAFSRITGYSQEEVLGWNCNFLQRTDTAQANRALIRAAISKREPLRTLMRNYRRDGTLFWNELGLYPLSDAQGGEHACVLAADDSRSINRQRPWRLFKIENRVAVKDSRMTEVDIVRTVRS